MTYDAELLGGPRDGEHWALEEDLMVIRFAAMEQVNWIPEAEIEIPVPQLTEIQYIRTQNTKPGGVRLYRYVPPPTNKDRK